MYKAKGKIIFNPVPISGGTPNKKWWAIVKCPDDIIYYYKYWVTKNQKFTISSSAFGSHISLIRDEEPPNEFKHLWKKREGMEVEFTYTPNFQTNGEYWWLDIQCPVLNEVRQELGLSKEPKFGYHLSIGKRNR